MSSLRRARSASVASTCSSRFFSRITRWEFCGFDHRFGSADCFSISASCGRSLSASKILPKFVDLLAQLLVFLLVLLNHEEISAFLRFLRSKNDKRDNSTAIEIIAQPYANQSPFRV
jgi:hypothetical protein